MIIDYLGSCFIYQQTLHFLCQFHPSSIHMMRMDDDLAFISPNGTKSHITCKDWTSTKHEIWVLKLFKLLPICLWTKKFEANLKGLPWGLKRTTKRQRSWTLFSIRQPRKKHQKWAVPWDPNTILGNEVLNHQPVGSL